MRKTIALPALCVILVAMDLAVTPVWADESPPSATFDRRSSEHDGATTSVKSETTSANAFGEPAEGRTYVHLEPIVLPVISDTGVDQLVTIRIDLEATSLDASYGIRVKFRALWMPS